jgi:hypothetical protein
LRSCLSSGKSETRIFYGLHGPASIPNLTTALAGSSGLCLPHFSRALEWVDDADTLKQLVALQRRTLTELRGELAEFIRKNNYRFRHEGFGKEVEAGGAPSALYQRNAVCDEQRGPANEKLRARLN